MDGVQFYVKSPIPLTTDHIIPRPSIEFELGLIETLAILHTFLEGDWLWPIDRLWPDILHTFAKIGEMYLDMKEDFNADFLNIALSYRVREETIGKLIKGMDLGTLVLVTEVEALNFKVPLKTVSLEVDEETSKCIENLYE